ncbi:MAG: RNA polymerase sigma factor [Actinomycetota bacterium]|nr:RNA polymerase sigma factor [Actinomycetota bacterium]
MKRQARDEEFRAFFVADGARLERFATMLVGDPVEGAELAQEALVRIYSRWGRIRSGSPWAYARQTILNLVRSAHRARKLRAVNPVPGWVRLDETTSVDVDDLVGDSMRVIDALRHLSPTRRATILLRFYEDMAEQEIATTLDRPLGTVKSDIHRGLLQLRPLLEESEAKGRTR